MHVRPAEKSCRASIGTLRTMANGAQYTRGLHWYAIATQTLLIQ